MYLVDASRAGPAVSTELRAKGTPETGGLQEQPTFLIQLGSSQVWSHSSSTPYKHVPRGP